MANAEGAKRTGEKLTVTTIKAAATVARGLPKGGRTILWDGGDGGVKGLGLRLSHIGATWILNYRAEDGRQRRMNLASWPNETPDGARDLARAKLHEVAQGQDPAGKRRAAREASTVADLAERYLREHARPHKKERSAKSDEDNLRLHVRPRLGSRKVASVTYNDVADLHNAIGASGPKPHPGAANRTLALLSKMFNLAEKWGLRPLNSNPCRHVQRFRERKLHRDLLPLELRRLANALRDWPREPRKIVLLENGDRKPRSRSEEKLPLTPDEIAVRDQACDVLRLILFSGMRRGEALNLAWSEVDLDRGLLRLADSKTGSKVLVLNSAAREVIERQPRVKVDVPDGWPGDVPENPLVFPSRRKGRGHGEAIHDLKNAWTEVCRLAELEGVRVHDLRHSFASWGAAGGAGLPVIGKLLGHKSPQTTARYADVAQDPARRASEAIGQAITRAMESEEKAS
jgi:integrase